MTGYEAICAALVLMVVLCVVEWIEQKSSVTYSDPFDGSQ